MSRPRGYWDRTETPEEVDEATQIVLRLQEHLQQLPIPADPLPGSMLATEDVATAREPISTLVRGMRNRAVDGLEMFMDATIHADRQQMWARPIAPFALLRMSVEALGVGRWLIASSRKNERILRALRLSFDDAVDAHDFALQLANSAERDEIVRRHRRSEERLNQLKDAVPQLRQITLTGVPTYTHILKSVSPVVRPGGTHDVDSPFIVWKMCSGILHGNQSVIRLVSDVEQLDEWRDGQAQFRLTPRWGVISGALFTCMRELRALDERTKFLSTHNYAEQEVVDVTPAP
ncbi:hypothetical protein [Microbacterium arborescens]